MKDKLPTPEEFFSGKLPEDNVTPEQFEAAVEIVKDFSRLDIDSVKSKDDFARVTRDLGLSILRLVLSCGQIQITNFSFEDPRKIARGEALIQAGDVSLGNGVKSNAESSFSSKGMIIRTKEEDGSSTIVSTQGDSDESLLITNDRFKGEEQISNYKVNIPVVVEIDKVNDWVSVCAQDWRTRPASAYFPLMEGSDINTTHGYLRILQELVNNILKHLEKKKYIV